MMDDGGPGLDGGLAELESYLSRCSVREREPRYPTCDAQLSDREGLRTDCQAAFTAPAGRPPVREKQLIDNNKAT